LLGDLIAHRLRAFGVVGAQVHVHEAPVVAVGNLRAQAVDVVVIAIDANQGCAVDLGVENLGGLKIGRHQDEGFEAQACGLRGNCVGQVAGGGAADRVKSKGLGIGQRHGDHTILEAQRGQADGVVFDVEIGGSDVRAKPRRLHERCQTGRRLRLVGVGNRQQGAISPHVQGAGGNGFAGKAGAGIIEVEGDLKR